MHEGEHLQVDIEQQRLGIELQHPFERRVLAAGVWQVLVSSDKPLRAWAVCEHGMHRVGTSEDTFSPAENFGDQPHMGWRAAHVERLSLLQILTCRTAVWH